MNRIVFADVQRVQQSLNFYGDSVSRSLSFLETRAGRLGSVSNYGHTIVETLQLLIWEATNQGETNNSSEFLESLVTQ